MSLKTKVVQKTNGQKQAIQNVVPRTLTPQQALQSIRNIMGNVVLIARSTGNDAGLTLNDRVNIEQWFELIKAALPE